MIDAVTTQELRQLAKPASGHQISIFSPTHPSGPEKAQDPVRLKQLLDAAKQQLTELGMRGPDAAAFLSPAKALVDDEAFWASVESGLAVFVNNDGLRHYRLGHAPLARSVVADRFQLRPLLPEISTSDEYWVLALSLGEVRLLRGSRAYGMQRAYLGDAPTSLEAALRFDDRERQLQSHASSRVGAGGVGVTMHGQGGVKDSADEERRRFCQIVDGHVHEAIGDSVAPVVLAGERRLLDDYKQLSRLGHLVEHDVVGSPDDASDQQLGDDAWEVVQAASQRQLLDEIAHFSDAIDRRTSSLSETVLAAIDGQVDSLIVPLDTKHYGVLDRRGRVVDDRPVGSAGVGDLFDLAVAEVLRHGGRVRGVASAMVPGPGPVAATLRY